MSFYDLQIPIFLENSNVFIKIKKMDVLLIDLFYLCDTLYNLVLKASILTKLDSGWHLDKLQIYFKLYGLVINDMK